MDRHIETILQNQQMHARIKHTSPTGLSQIFPDAHAQGSSPLAKHIILTIKKNAWRNRIRKCLRIGCNTFLLLCISFFTFIMCFPFEAFTSGNTDYDRTTAADGQLEQPTGEYPHGTAYSPSSPTGQAELAIEAGNFEEAKQILDDAMAQNPNLWLSIPYAELYDAMGESDKAVSLLVDTIYDRFHVQNMNSPQNTLYASLKKIPPESLTTSAEQRQRCLSDCDKYIEKYETINQLIEDEFFYQALILCEALKSEGAYDTFLYYDFYQCYVGLKAYDECEAYLRSLYGKQTDIFDHRYPLDQIIESLLHKLQKY